MMKMLGRLMWVAVGALGAKAWQAVEEENRRTGANGGGNAGTSRSRGRTRNRGGGSGSSNGT